MKRERGRPRQYDGVVLLRLPKDVIKRVRLEARRTGSDRSSVIRRAISKGLPKPNDMAPVVLGDFTKLESLAKKYPKHPGTFIANDKGWTFGLWYTSTSFQKSKLYGSYPVGFLNRVLAMFPGVPRSEILHCPSGSLPPRKHGVTVDIVRGKGRRPEYVADATDLPFVDQTFSLILSDPPYSDADSRIYKTKPWPMKRALAEFNRVLKPGGHLAMLHLYFPQFSKRKWKLVGLIACVLGANRQVRLLSIFEKL